MKYFNFLSATFILLSVGATTLLAQGHEGSAGNSAGHGEVFIPTDVNWADPVYETSFEHSGNLEDWILEGGQSIRIVDGSLVLSSDSTDRDDHLVAWLRKEIPADFLLEFTLRPKNRSEGLNIVFFNARGVNGEHVFDPGLQPRDGTFRQYHSGDLNSYHISYWAGERDATHLRKNVGFDLVATGKDLVRSAPAEAFQTLRVYKRGGMIRLMVDDVVALEWEDDGKTHGPVHEHSGWIGLRQMGHTGSTEYGRVGVYGLEG